MGVSKAQISEGRYEAKVEFPEGWWGRGGLNQKTTVGGEMDVFWNNTLQFEFSCI